MPDNEHTIVAPFFDIGFNVGSEENLVRVGTQSQSKFCMVVTRQKHITWKEDLEFLKNVADEVGVLNECVRYREKRIEERSQSLFRISTLCRRWKKVLPLNLMQWTLDEISTCLPKSDIYISQLQRGGDEAKVSEATYGAERGAKSEELSDELLMLWERSEMCYGCASSRRSSWLARELTARRLVPPFNSNFYR